MAEEFIAWGAKQLVSISMCGGLQPALKAGDIVFCNRAIRDEGPSHHYLSSEKFVDCNADLAQRLADTLSTAGQQPALDHLDDRRGFP